MCADLDRADRNPEKALELLKRLVGTMVELFCGHPVISWHAKRITREQMSPSPAFDILYEKVIRRGVNLIAQLISAATGEINQQTNAFQVFILIGQVMMFRHAKEAIVRHLDLEGYRQAETDEIRKQITGWIDKTLAPGP